MITVVFYEPEPDDESSGRIIYSGQSDLVSLSYSHLAWIQVDVLNAEYTNTHRVLNWQLVDK